MMTDAERAAAVVLAAGLACFEDESGGVLDVMIVRPPDGMALFEAGRAGDPKAGRLAQAVLALIERANGTAGMQCGSCDAWLADAAFSAVVVLPSRDDPTKGVALGICSGCAREPEAILARAIEALRQAFPGIRRIEMQGHAAGRV